ncbi:MAG: hypothetical protein LBD20_08830 [Spirochaetaceae bacterium]|jgi:hypothetical protein|nr:hypothetical protein [Spirochaetaceae bacterium]
MSETDLLTQLRNFAARRVSPFVEEKYFYNELLAIAFFKRRENSKWAEWFSQIEYKYKMELEHLVREGHCEKKIVDEKGRLFFSDFIADAVRDLWVKSSANPNELFPSKSSVSFEIPDDLIKTVTADDWQKIIANPPEAKLPVFNLLLGNCGSILVLSTFITTRLLDGAFLKIKEFLVDPQAKEYCRNAIKGMLPSIESSIDVIFNTIRRETTESIRDIEESNTDVHRFWICLCKCLKSIRESLKILEPRASVVIQAAAVIEIYNKYYHDKMSNEIGQSSVMKEIEQQLMHSPYFFSLTMILNFTNKYGKPITSIATRNDLTNMLLKRSHASRIGKLPDILGFADSHKEQMYVLKNCLFHGVEHKINRVKTPAADAIKQEWLKIVKEYHKTNAMKNDIDFETEVIKKVRSIDSFLLIVYLDSRLVLLKNEMTDSEFSVSPAEAFFEGPHIKPLHKLLHLDRRFLLSQVHSELPIWYRIPLFVVIIRVLRGIHD